MNTPHNQDNSLFFPILSHTVLGVLSGTLLVFCIAMIVTAFDDGVINTLANGLMILPLFLLFGAILGGIPALLTGIVVACHHKYHIRKLPAIVLHPASVGFMVSFIYALIISLFYFKLKMLEATSLSLGFACIGGFSGFVAHRFTK